jgi:hypothetical protein
MGIQTLETIGKVRLPRKGSSAPPHPALRSGQKLWGQCAKISPEGLPGARPIKPTGHRGNLFHFKKPNSQAQVAYTLILATQEAEIRRIMVQSQSRQTVHETLSLKKKKEKKKEEA